MFKAIPYHYVRKARSLLLETAGCLVCKIKATQLLTELVEGHATIVILVNRIEQMINVGLRGIPGYISASIAEDQRAVGPRSNRRPTAAAWIRVRETDIRSRSKVCRRMFGMGWPDLC